MEHIPPEPPIIIMYLLFLVSEALAPSLCRAISTLAFQHFLHLTCALNMYTFRVGPLVNCWCMRMEAKNSFFKRVAQIGNYRNVPYSVSARHQRLLCAYLQGPFFTYEDLECGPCMSNFVC